MVFRHLWCFELMIDELGKPSLRSFNWKLVIPLHIDYVLAHQFRVCIGKNICSCICI